MREGAPDDVMATAFRWQCIVQSWGPTGELLAEEVPFSAGSLSWDVSARAVPEQCTLTVPRYSVWDGRRKDWLPQEDVNHPLAAFGQTLTISVLIESVVSRLSWVTDLARVRIQEWNEDESGAVLVTAVGLLQGAEDDTIQVPQSPDEEATLVSEFARLLPGSLSVLVGDTINDRTCQPGTQWAGSRLTTLYEIADALPARLRTDEDGNVVMLLPQLDDTPDPVAIYRDGELHAGSGMATLVSAPRSDTRRGVVNALTVLPQNVSSDSTVSVEVMQTTGPFAVDTYGKITGSWSSEQVTSEEEALATGQARLAAGLRPARTVQVVITPDPRIEPDDAVEVIRDGVRRRGYVLASTIDLTGAGQTTLTVGISSELGTGGD